MKERKSTTKLAHHQDQNGHPPFKFAQLFDSEASWDKDQLGDTLHWIRQVVALICGLVCGAIPLIGGIWILLFLAISSAIVYGYYALILKVDEEEFGGHGTLLMEGLFASFTLFLLSWIVVYSLGISDS
uniref:Rab5-interacting protein n=1 Tax=Kalanchoe fedtschenkoi TaxID=63787 RepID=A0A7N0TD07_KALFE